MEYSLEDKYRLIRQEALKQTSKNPIVIAIDLMRLPCVSPNGPEHHFLDGASFLVAYKNAGGKIDIEESLDLLAKRSIGMPGAMCGYWGVCGSAASIGASLSIIHGTGPLSDNDYYKQTMEYTSSAIEKMSQIGGPRCCKRNAFISLREAALFVRSKYGIAMELSSPIVCEFSLFNKQCLGKRCPFNPKSK